MGENTIGLELQKMNGQASKAKISAISAGKFLNLQNEKSEHFIRFMFCF